MTQYTRGNQVIYVPEIAGGDLDHPAVENGFVTSDPGGDAVFCRYWSKYRPGKLRTEAGSELTPTSLLRAVDTVPQARVDAALNEILRWRDDG